MGDRHRPDRHGHVVVLIRQPEAARVARPVSSQLQQGTPHRDCSCEEVHLPVLILTVRPVEKAPLTLLAAASPPSTAAPAFTPARAPRIIRTPLRLLVPRPPALGPCPPGTNRPPPAATKNDSSQLVSRGEAWLIAAIPMENPYCGETQLATISSAAALRISGGARPIACSCSRDYQQGLQL